MKSNILCRFKMVLFRSSGLLGEYLRLLTRIPGFKSPKKSARRIPEKCTPYKIDCHFLLV